MKIYIYIYIYTYILSQQKLFEDILFFYINPKHYRVSHRVRWPNFLKAKWGQIHTANFKMFMHYNCCPPFRFQDSSVITDQRPSSTLMVLGACKSVLSVMSSKFSAKSPPLGYLAKVLDSPLVHHIDCFWTTLRNDYLTIDNSARHSCNPTLNPLNLNYEP